MPSTSDDVRRLAPGDEVGLAADRRKERTGELTPPGIDPAGPGEQLGVASRPARSATEHLGQLAGEVGEDDVRAGPLDRGQLLERHGRAVDPAPLAAAAWTMAYSPAHVVGRHRARRLRPARRR